jgi:hypothetical protein
MTSRRAYSLREDLAEEVVPFGSQRSVDIPQLFEECNALVETKALQSLVRKAGAIEKGVRKQFPVPCWGLGTLRNPVLRVLIHRWMDRREA